MARKTFLSPSLIIDLFLYFHFDSSRATAADATFLATSVGLYPDTFRPFKLFLFLSKGGVATLELSSSKFEKLNGNVVRYDSARNTYILIFDI